MFLRLIFVIPEIYITILLPFILNIHILSLIDFLRVRDIHKTLPLQPKLLHPTSSTADLCHSLPELPKCFLLLRSF